MKINYRIKISAFAGMTSTVVINDAVYILTEDVFRPVNNLTLRDDHNRFGNVLF